VKLVTIVVVGAGLLAGSALAAQDESKAKAKAGPELKDMMQKASYGLGVLSAKNFKKMAVNIDPDLFANGFKDAMTDAKIQLTDQQIQEALQSLQRTMMARQAESSKGLAEKNLKEGGAFLAANKSKPGVKTLPSGLQYKVLKEGTGRSPKATDTVSANYRGTLVDGTEFDNSQRSGGPVPFPVNRVIKGWTEALQMMKVGSKWQLFIPPELAYGATPDPNGPIPPNATLVFDVELVGIK
jgi:FKBP-type peptidyl-prolyl cis-trans isomerase FklB